jgi:hypothetical protein
MTSLFTVSASEQPETEGVGLAVDKTAVAVDVIVGIDQETRAITLKNAEGDEWVFVAGPEVRNFDQLKRGDLVILDYYAGFALELKPQGSGIKGRISEMSAERAKAGEKPGLKVTNTTYAFGKVTAIDLEHREVTLQGVEKTVVLGVSDEVDLSKIEVGQQVEAAYVESYVIAVEPAPKVSGTVNIKSTSIAIGIGVEWGKGTLTMYDGTTHDFKISGLSVLDLGVTSIEATGEVYHLVEAKDLAGSFVTGEVGAAFIGGGSAVAMKNENGVVMKLKTTQKGVKLTAAGKGMTVELQ